MANSGNGSAQAAVVITTKNRIDDLRKAVASAIVQTARPEILVVDDGSTDGTADTITQEFPGVCLHRTEKSCGYIVQRNRGAGLATAPIVFSIDDDAVFSSPLIIEQTLQGFNHPRVGAVAIPFVDVNRGPEVKQRAPGRDGIYATFTFIGTAHALRRDLFLKLGGYRQMLFHQGEEEDYCTRLLDAGYITRCGTADPIHHFESPQRSWKRMDYYGSRNKILYSWQNVPFPFLPVHLAATSAKTLAYSFRPGRFWTRLRGVVAGYTIGLLGRAGRRPVARNIYRLSRELKQRGPVPLHEIEKRLPRIESLRTNNDTMACAC